MQIQSSYLVRVGQNLVPVALGFLRCTWTVLGRYLDSYSTMRLRMTGWRAKVDSDVTGRISLIIEVIQPLLLIHHLVSVNCVSWIKRV